ncbi:nucleolin-like isoform X2 [Chelmon rostratus]|uniref:nucleolin-like isoform X2 n=1 Tax=Chelmon rostratus TaxID=109905 RepID=UPI001BEBA031|nr:nucleolin-like isoform X2 [Chelmon rostratus]
MWSKTVQLLMRPNSEEKQSRENRPSLTFSSSTKLKKDKNASDASSDDEPLIKMKTVKKYNTSTRSNGRNSNKADVNTDESSDNETLIKIAKVSSKAVNKSFSVPPKKSVDTETRESQDNDDASDDEPLSELAKKLNSKRQRKASVLPSRKATPVLKSKRNSAMKTVKYAESSSDSSDNEPLATTKRKLTMALKEQKTLPKGKKTKQKLKDISLKDSSLDDDDDDDDDDVPLVNLIAKKKAVKKNTKTTAVSQGSASRKRRGLPEESSEDEPLINLVKKNRTDKQTKSKTKASALEKRDTTPEKPRKMLVSGSSHNRSDDEPLIKAARHPQVTKILRIILERCDGEETGSARSLNKTSAGTPVAEKSEESDGSEKSPEEA